MTKSILLVDDDPDILIIFKKILEEEGYTVYTAKNIEKAKAIVKEHEVQLVIMDYFLQGINGVQIAEALKKIDEKLQIIFLTGYTPVLDAVDGLGFDVYKVFLKPITIEELLSAIRSIYAEENGLHQVYNPYTNVVSGNVGGQQPHL